MELWQRALIAFVGGLCFSISFKAPRRLIFLTSCLAVICEVGQAVLSNYFDSAQKTTFAVSLCLALVSQALARATKAPAQIFLIPGFILLVPGIKLYEGVAFALDKQYFLLAASWIQAGIIAAGLSFTILVANWIFPSKQEL